MRAAVVGSLAVVVAATLLPAGSAPATAVVAAPGLAPAGSGWLTVVNDVRAASGVAPLAERSTWSTGIRAHLTYLARTPASYRTGAYASAHTENPASPWYTAAGALEARSSDLVTAGTSSDRAAVEAWLRAPFHAIGILRPGLTATAFARDPLTGAAGLDVIRGLGTAPARTTPILFPGPGSTTNLRRFTGETPSPLETCGWRSAGLPLIALLPSAPVSGLAAELVQPDGSRLSSSAGNLCVVSELNYRSSDAVYGATGRSTLDGADAVLVIPPAPLQPGVQQVSITQPGRAPISWSFTAVDADLSPPSALLTAPTAPVRLASTVSVAWSGRDDNGPVSSFQVQRAVKAPGGALSSYADLGGPRTTTALTMTRARPGFAYCFRVRATDRAGNVGPWSPARCTTVPGDDRALTASRGWVRGKASAAWLGTVTATGRRGTALTLPRSRGGSLVLLVTQRPGGGTFGVYVGTRRVAVVSTAARTVRPRTPVTIRVRTAGAAVSLRVLSPGRGVTIDGIAQRP